MRPGALDREVGATGATKCPTWANRQPETRRLRPPGVFSTGGDTVARAPSESVLFDRESELDLEGPAPGIDPADLNPNHHLWRNGRLWWIAFTVHRGHQQERVRFSLGTADVEEARRRRDRALALLQRAKDLKISLRFASRSGGAVA